MYKQAEVEEDIMPSQSKRKNLINSIHTVEKHLTGAYKKLGVKGRAEAILWWVQNGRGFRD